jgi:hypothetical protein
LAKQRKRKSSKPKDAAKEAEKRARREERKASEEAEKKREARRRQVRMVGIGAVAVLIVVGVGFWLSQRLFPAELVGVEQPTNLGRGHIAAGEPANYATATPTSGPHAASSARCGIYSQQIPAEFAVHALEHGAVVIWYRHDLEDEVGAALRDIVDDFDERVILSPNATMTEPIVATAWNRLKRYDSVEPEIEEFITTYRGRGPERIGCPY